VISLFTSLQPLIMSILLALSFSLIIISPLSTVAIALLISISGLSSGAANLGIVGTSFTLALLSYKENGLGCALVHFIGSPKIQMANFIKRPIMFIPSLFSAFLCGIISYLFAIQGTPISAGFGISGLIGPLAHLSSEGFTSFNLFIVLIAFVILPIIISISSMYLFRNILKLVKPEDYKINI
ncbi:MAG: PTS sugar transporter subunit IIC, partial [Erysipelotrichales bacterium]